MDDSFPIAMHSQLGYYVYRLIDPRDGNTFYVGKGRGNRVFDHMKGLPRDLEDSQSSVEDELSQKMRVIREIINEGLKPLHIIHRHGLTDDEAKLAEAVLIDAIPGLTNIMGGYHSGLYGPSNAIQLLNRYQMDVAEIPNGLKVMAINIRTSFTEHESVYEAVRGFWRVDVSRAEHADLVLAVRQGICRGVFEVNEWRPANRLHFPELRENIPGRSGFVGHPAEQRFQEIFLHKRLPEEFQRRKGMASPVLYNYDRPN